VKDIHGHDFSVIQEHGERRTLQVLLLTAITMVVEITAGSIFGSMALLADGWHMGTHVAPFSITIFAYRYPEQDLFRRLHWLPGQPIPLPQLAS
jgi:Co/Zn/Cd efflux system component